MPSRTPVGACGALDDEPRPERLRDRLFQKLRQAKGQARDGVRMTEPGRREQVVEALRELGADRGGQLLDALEMIIEGPLRDARSVHDGIHRERVRRPLGKQDFRAFQDLRPGPGALSRPISARRARSTFAIIKPHSDLRHNFILTI